MKSTNTVSTSDIHPQKQELHKPDPAKERKELPKLITPLGIRTTARDYANPVDYKHPYPSMAQFADLLALHYDADRTRHSYYLPSRYTPQAKQRLY